MKAEKILLIIAGVIFLSGCSNVKESYREFKKTEESVPFPHPDNWYLKENHGLTAMNLGKSSCSAGICHGDDLTGGTSGVSCYACHSTYPHEKGWAYGDKHWQKVLEAGKEQCAGCHGEDFSGGDTGVSCYSCHELYPHSDGWENVTSHGVFARIFSGDKCVNCHGEDYSGGDSGVSCYSCHYLYPHQKDWDLITGHGSYLVSKNFNNSMCATSCHGRDLNGGYSSVSCYSCHALYPHSSDWGSAPGFEHPHADYVEANGDVGCINCHVNIKSDYQNSNPECQYCH